MTSGLEDENQALRYLLREMPDDERSSFEDRCFTDDSFYEAVLAAEDDLIDSYVRGELAATYRHLFEVRYLAVARLSRRVAFARALLERTADRSHTPLSVGLEHWRSSPAIWFGAAATLVVIFGLSWWLAHRNKPAGLPASIAQKERGSAQTDGSAPRSRPASSYVAFVLRAGAERGAAMQARLVIPQTVEQVRLAVRLEATGFRDYDAVLRTVEGKEVWKTSHAAGQRRTINLTIPANLFQSADYVLTVSGSKSDGMREVAGEYPFSVRKQS